MACLIASSSVRGQELVQRRVEQADGDRQAVHGLEDLDEVGLLRHAQLLEGGLLLLGRVGQDHAAHDRQAVLAEEHVLGAAQADALGAELAGVGRVGTVVGVGPHAELALADLVGPPEDDVELGRRLGLRTARRSPSTTSPVVPSIEMTSPSLHGDAADGERLSPVMRIASAPTTAGLPQPRATTAAWLTSPPRPVRMPSATDHAVHVLG